MNNPREAALKVLFKIDYEGAYSNLALKGGLEGLKTADRALATRIVYGCVSMKITLDYIISLYSKTKIQKLSRSVLELLRMGIYQIMFMDRIPDSAAVNESVKLAAKYENRSRGFINAILRRVSAEKDKIEYPAEPVEYLRTRYSFPKKLCEKLIAEFGADFASELIKSFSSEPETVIRVNNLRTDRESLIKALKEQGLSAAPVAELPQGVVISGGDIAGIDEFKKGMFTVQDTAAQLACTVLNPIPDDTVFDLCAAPGGKTTYLAELMENRGEITAFDIHPHKTVLVEDAAERLGIDIITACAADTSVYRSSMAKRADKVLVDAPCSGLGIIRRKPDIKWNREDTSGLPQIQKKLLENGAEYLKSGGELVYSTCTVLSEENEKVVEAVLAEYPELETVDITSLLPEKFRKPSAKQGYITLFPHTDGTDGFFICKIRKKS
ncbi:MAG: 16S rRNA (cytosine(967)-C(5))-methyltransferase RsmB [Clostridia bacterium]|nr:16S rRNA (cytosine(967)-C(5))-methyltransferase RsmB [Clostridia bacterium]